MTTNELIELDRGECLQLLLQQAVGRVAATVGAQPHIVPVTYAADTDGDVVFRTGPETILTKLELARVAFEIDGVDEQARSGWSVCIHGVGCEITDVDDPTSRFLRQKLGESWAPGPRPRWFAIYPRQIMGRRLQAGAHGDISWFPGVPWS